MSFFIMLVIVWLVVSRLRVRSTGYGALPWGCARGRGLRRPHRFGQLPGALPVLHDYRPERPRPVRTESRFELLKRRYVSGELTDEEYEQQIDELLRQPGGMKEV